MLLYPVAGKTSHWESFIRIPAWVTSLLARLQQIVTSYLDFTATAKFYNNVVVIGLPCAFML